MFKKFLPFFAAMCLSFFSKAQSVVVDSIMFDNVWRNYRLFLPHDLNHDSYPPLVINMHGLGSNAVEEELYTGFDNIADTAGFVVCYPNGINEGWNSFNSTGGNDDAGFIDKLITVLSDQYNVNRNKVYATGMSNGGFMSYFLACNMTNRFAAIASVAGTSSAQVLQLCSPSEKIPVMHIQGTADNTVPYNGTAIFTSVSQILNFYALNNGCSLTADTFLLPNISETDLCTAERITFRDCDSDMQVVLYRIVGGEHTWPGASVDIGITNRDFNASAEMWKFFDGYSLSLYEEPKQISGIVLYPNPSSGKIQVTNPGNKNATIRVFQSDGRIVRTSSSSLHEIPLDLSSLQSGIYFIEFETLTEKSVFKFFKTRE